MNTLPQPRKGATRPDDVPADVLDQLNTGQIESATLAEGLAIDFGQLLHAVAPDIAAQVATQINPSDGIVKRMATAGSLLLDQRGPAHIPAFASHQSDTVRGWSAFMMAALPARPIAERLEMMRPLANDTHFGVREWAWLALRPHIAEHLSESIALLAAWTQDTSPNVRRFAVESTRPRGVWCAHISDLKREPEQGLPLLEPVRADTSRYVQQSVANWLNDASKTRGDWVQAICARWQAESSRKETTWIIQRALRTLREMDGGR